MGICTDSTLSTLRNLNYTKKLEKIKRANAATGMFVNELETKTIAQGVISGGSGGRESGNIIFQTYDQKDLRRRLLLTNMQGLILKRGELSGAAATTADWTDPTVWGYSSVQEKFRMDNFYAPGKYLPEGNANGTFAGESGSGSQVGFAFGSSGGGTVSKEISWSQTMGMGFGNYFPVPLTDPVLAAEVTKGAAGSPLINVITKTIADVLLNKVVPPSAVQVTKMKLAAPQVSFPPSVAAVAVTAKVSPVTPEQEAKITQALVSKKSTSKFTGAMQLAISSDPVLSKAGMSFHSAVPVDGDEISSSTASSSTAGSSAQNAAGFAGQSGGQGGLAAGATQQSGGQGGVNANGASQQAGQAGGQAQGGQCGDGEADARGRPRRRHRANETTDQGGPDKYKRARPASSLSGIKIDNKFLGLGTVRRTLADPTTNTPGKLWVEVDFERKQILDHLKEKAEKAENPTEGLIPRASPSAASLGPAATASATAPATTSSSTGATAPSQDGATSSSADGDKEPKGRLERQNSKKKSRILALKTGNQKSSRMQVRKIVDLILKHAGKHSSTDSEDDEGGEDDTDFQGPAGEVNPAQGADPAASAPPEPSAGSSPVPDEGEAAPVKKQETLRNGTVVANSNKVEAKNLQSKKKESKFDPDNGESATSGPYKKSWPRRKYVYQGPVNFVIDPNVRTGPLEVPEQRQRVRNAEQCGRRCDEKAACTNFDFCEETRLCQLYAGDISAETPLTEAPGAASLCRSMRLDTNDNTADENNPSNTAIFECDPNQRCKFDMDPVCQRTILQTVDSRPSYVGVIEKNRDFCQKRCAAEPDHCAAGFNWRPLKDSESTNVKNQEGQCVLLAKCPKPCLHKGDTPADVFCKRLPPSESALARKRIQEEEADEKKLREKEKKLTNLLTTLTSSYNKDIKPTEPGLTDPERSPGGQTVPAGYFGQVVDSMDTVKLPYAKRTIAKKVDKEFVKKDRSAVPNNDPANSELPSPQRSPEKLAEKKKAQEKQKESAAAAKVLNKANEEADEVGAAGSPAHVKAKKEKIQGTKDKEANQKKLSNLKKEESESEREELKTNPPKLGAFDNSRMQKIDSSADKLKGASSAEPEEDADDGDEADEEEEQEDSEEPSLPAGTFRTLGSSRLEKKSLQET